jgi:hypothetical protein
VFQGTEVNPEFVGQVLGKLQEKERKGAILVCTVGGSLEPEEGKTTSLQSRSLIAAYQLIQAGALNISILKGGYTDWEKQGRAVEQ